MEARTSEIPKDLGKYFSNTINTTVVKNVETLVDNIANAQNLLELTFLDKSETIMKPLINLRLKTFNIPAQKIAGRLKFHLENWSKITSDQVILKNIQRIDINFLKVPVQLSSHNMMVVNNQEKILIDQEVQEMLSKGVIVQVPPCKNQFLSNLFLVHKKDGGQRPVINLKNLNHFVMYQHFKMEGLYMVKDLLQKGDYLIKIDLKDAYSVMSISPIHRKYLRFQTGEGSIFEYTALPFGLGEAPRLFTKTLKPVIGLLRRLGIRMIVYLDDILLMAESQQKLICHRDSTLFLLQKLGFVIN